MAQLNASLARLGSSPSSQPARSARLSNVAARLVPSAVRKLPAVRSSDADPSTSYAVLESFHYGRAFATAFNRRLGELLVDVVSGVSRRIAERPERIRDFQEEVTMLARRDMGLPEVATSSAGPGDSMDAKTRMGATRAAEPQDLQAVVDEIRAEAASARYTLQQIKLINGAAATTTRATLRV